MAGTFITINTKGFDKLSKYLKKVAAFTKTPRKLYADTAMIMFQDVMDHFRKEEGPDRRWTKLKAATIARRRKEGKDHKILQDEGVMRGSIVPYWSARGAGVGTDDIKAATHQFGRGKIPARPYMWLSKKAADRIANRATFYLKRM